MAQGRKLSDWIDGWVKYTDTTEPPLSYRQWVAISLIAAALQRKVYFDWDNRIYPNFYIVLVGPAGRCRKGTAMKPAETLLRRLAVPMSSESTTREALIRELREANSSYISEDGIPHFYSSLTVFSKELAVFLGYSNTTMMEDLADWYDCPDNWRYKTKHQGVDDIDGVWVNIIGATTPEQLQNTISKDLIGIGLASRMMFVFEQDKGKTVVDPRRTKQDDHLAEVLFEDLRTINMARGEMKITDGWLKRWKEWYPAQGKHKMFSDDRLAGYASRRGTHLQKISMIANVSRDGGMLMDVDDFDRALDIMTTVEKKMKYAFTGLGRNVLSAIMHEVMRKLVARKEILYSQLLTEHYHQVNDTELWQIVQALQKIKFAHAESTGSDFIIKYIPREDDII